MRTYDWEATAYDSENRKWQKMQGQFKVDLRSENPERVAERVAQGHAAAIGCDPASIDGLHYDFTDCDHADFFDAMDGSATCNDCGKKLKGLAD